MATIQNLYSQEIQTAWATIFAYAWSFSLGNSKVDFETYKNDKVKNVVESLHFHYDLILDPRRTLEAAKEGAYSCSEYKNPSLAEAAAIIISSGFVLPFPHPTVDGLHAEQLRQFFDQEGITGILRFT